MAVPVIDFSAFPPEGSSYREPGLAAAARRYHERKEREKREAQEAQEAQEQAINDTISLAATAVDEDAASTNDHANDKDMDSKEPNLSTESSENKKEPDQKSGKWKSFKQRIRNNSKP